MNIKEFKEKLSEMGVDERKEQVEILLQMLAPPSLGTLKEFQDSWHSGRTYEEFVLAQNKQILGCLDLELSPFGGDVRKSCGMNILTEKTEIEVQSNA